MIHFNTKICCSSSPQYRKGVSHQVPRACHPRHRGWPGGCEPWEGHPREVPEACGTPLGGGVCSMHFFLWVEVCAVRIFLETIFQLQFFSYKFLLENFLMIFFAIIVCMKKYFQAKCFLAGFVRKYSFINVTIVNTAVTCIVYRDGIMVLGLLNWKSGMDIHLLV